MAPGSNEADERIADLASQVTSLNAKLVAAYEQIGDLEEELDRTASAKEHLLKRVSQLDSERKQWEERVEGGLLVEKAHVQQELTRMMDAVIAETAERGKAEQDKKSFEDELESLSASLFDEANRMVAVERAAKLEAEAKTASLEARLNDTESIIHSQSKQMSNLGAKTEALERERDELKSMLANIEQDPSTKGNQQDLKLVMADGQAVKPLPRESQPPSPALAGLPNAPTFSFARALPLLNQDVLPFQEFSLFVRHLARARNNAERQVLLDNPPASAGSQVQEALNALVSVSAHSSHPFLKRCIEEDSEPTLRLDLAPGLNWLSRRSVNTAILDGYLVIEPLFGSAPPTASVCALCGTNVEQSPNSSLAQDKEWSGSNTVRKLIDKSGNWASAYIRSSSPTSKASQSTASSSGHPPPQQVFIFRTDSPNQNNSRHPLCHVYCLNRLRAVCEFWGFVRSFIRAVVVDEIQKKPFVAPETQTPLPPQPGPASQASASSSTTSLAKSLPNEPAQGVEAGAAEMPKVEAPSEEPKAEAGDASETPSVEVATATTAVGPASSVEPASEEAPAEDGPSKEEDQDKAEPTSEPASSLPTVSSDPPVSADQPSKPPLPKRSSRRLAGDAAATSTPPPPLPPRRAVSAAASKQAGQHTPTLSRQNSYFNLQQAQQPKSWEDKTWAELVRLKEQLFWARVGAAL